LAKKIYLRNRSRPKQQRSVFKRKNTAYRRVLSRMKEFPVIPENNPEAVKLMIADFRLYGSSLKSFLQKVTKEKNVSLFKAVKDEIFVVNSAIQRMNRVLTAQSAKKHKIKRTKEKPKRREPIAA